MATNSSPCSSSSTNLLPSSYIKNEKTVLFSRFAVTVPRKSTGVTQIRSRVQGRTYSHIKSSNGHPLNAVSLKDGLDGKGIPVSEAEKEESTLSTTVVGASGDLAKKKIFPALFALFYEDWLPENFTVFGYARTKLNDEELRNMISGTLTCRVNQRENCEDKMDQFLKRCFYHAGQYDSEGDFSELASKLKEKELWNKK